MPGSAPALLGMARGAMDCFMQTLPTRGAITYTAWPKAAEAPLLHHQLAKAQDDLEAAEMFTSRLSALYRGVLHRPPTIMERARARAHIGHIASLSRACVNQLFEASSVSHTLLAADIQRYFRDINVLHQHAAIQPNSGDEVYDRVLGGASSRTPRMFELGVGVQPLAGRIRRRVRVAAPASPAAGRPERVG